MPRKTGTTLTRGTGVESKKTASSKPKRVVEETVFSFITVHVGKLPGKIHTIGLNGGRKVSDALEGANLDAEGYELRVNAAKATVNTELKQDDKLLLIKKIKGNLAFDKFKRGI